jgi:hypothetical protein
MSTKEFGSAGAVTRETNWKRKENGLESLHLFLGFMYMGIILVRLLPSLYFLEVLILVVSNRLSQGLTV